MKALFYNFPQKKFILKETSVPKIKEDEVLVNIKASALCGTDLHIIDGSLTPKVYDKKEIILGHSFSGVVSQIGKKIKRFKTGDRVFSSNFIWCGKCRKCREKNENLCDNRYIFGMEIPGSHAEYIKVPQRTLFHLPKNINFEEGSLITDLLTVCLHSIKKTAIHPNQKIIILGAGPMGLTLGMLLKSLKLRKISIVEPINYRRKLAEKLFNPQIIDNNNLKKHYGQFDIVFEASGSTQVLDSGFKLLKRGGNMIVIGVHNNDSNLNFLKLVSRELSLFGVFHYTSQDIKENIKILKEKKVNLGKIITHRLPLKEGEKAYRLLKTGKAGRIILF